MWLQRRNIRRPSTIAVTACSWWPGARSICAATSSRRCCERPDPLVSRQRLDFGRFPCHMPLMNKPVRADSLPNSPLAAEVERRRTFAIISHPDAGKTTITEKLLLFGGAINLAGQVKAKKSARHATSDWMEVEKQRGISVTSSVMQFDYADHTINLLDTPGHQDFSEDTYRVLTAVDAAVMVIDAAKGVEEQTIKLLEVC